MSIVCVSVCVCVWLRARSSTAEACVLEPSVVSFRPVERALANFDLDNKLVWSVRMWLGLQPVVLFEPSEEL